MVVLCHPALPPMPAQLREGLHTVRRMLLSANPYNPEPFIYPLQRYLHNDHSPYKLSRLVLSQVKIHLRHQLLHGARTFLRERPWAFSSSSFTLEALHVTPLKAIPPFSRLAILRWIIDFEPDVHFRLRPHIKHLSNLGRTSVTIVTTIKRLFLPSNTSRLPPFLPAFSSL